jgi:hypothetical protein
MLLPVIVPAVVDSQLSPDDPTTDLVEFRLVGAGWLEVEAITLRCFGAGCRLLDAATFVGGDVSVRGTLADTATVHVYFAGCLTLTEDDPFLRCWVRSDEPVQLELLGTPPQDGFAHLVPCKWFTLRRESLLVRALVDPSRVPVGD